MATVCNTEPFVPASLLKEFVVTIQIPVGFKLKATGDSNSYREYIAIDRNTIARLTTKTPVPADIQMPDGSTMNCIVEANTLTLKGSVLYNAILSGFVPGQSMQPDTDESEIIIAEDTAFSSPGIVEVNEVAVFGCPGCDLATWYAENYHVELAEGTAFLINNEGNVIPNHFPDDSLSNEFLEALNDAETAQVVHIPLQLRLVRNVVTP